MNSEAKLLLGLGIGVALGAAVGYIMGSDKKEEWLEQASEFADKVKANVKSAVYKGKSEVHDLKEDIDDIAEIAKKELAKQ
jgi:gas vesicle protein